MNFSASDLGDIERLARAIGLVKADGGFNDDWLSNPGDYLGATLSNDAQREALLGLVDDLLGGGTRHVDARGQIWLPLFESSDPPVSFSAVIDDRAVDHVRIGLGVELTSQNPPAAMRLHLPLFRAGRGGHTVGNPILLGQSGGIIDFSCDITVDTAAPVAGQAHLRAVGLVLAVPTDGGEPDFGITLSGLQLPGAGAPRDLALSLASVAELDDMVLDLVLGLLEAQARQAGGAVQSFARLIGLSDGAAIPRLPLEQLPAQGIGAIGSWAAALFGSAPARTAWLGELRSLLGAGAIVSGDRVELPFGVGRVTLGVDVVAGSGGFPVITPVFGIEARSGQAIARVQASLFRLDLGSRAAAALPALDCNVTFGKTPAGGSALLIGDPAVDAIRFGISLDQNRRPVATLALLNVRIGTHPPYPMLDLSSPNAVVESAGQVIGDVLDEVLAALGPLQGLLRTLLGLSVPAGIPGLTATSITAFLSDPLAAVRGYWRELLVNHAAGVPLVLAPLRDMIADQGVIALPVAGTGIPSDPWTIALVGPVKLRAWKTPGSNLLEIGLVAAYANDLLGERCTHLDAEIGVGLLAIDLDGGPASFLTAISTGIGGRPRGARRAAIEFPPLQISADSVGLSARWTPATGVKIAFAAPNPSVALNNREFPLDIPDLSAGFAGLTGPQWDAIEFLAGQLARLTPGSWVMDLTQALGWIPASPALYAADRPRLRLAALAANPQAAILDWLNAVVLVQSSRVERLLEPLARVLTGTAGSFGRIAGSGTPRDPYRVALSTIARTPELSLWVEPNGPPLEIFTEVTERLRAWRPGTAGLSSFELSDAMLRESVVAREISDLVSGRPDFGVGLVDLAERWIGTDGRILAPPAEPSGVTVHLVEDRAAAALGKNLDVANLLGVVPATVIHIAIATTAQAAPWGATSSGRLIDLTAPSLAPDAFASPVAGTGEWFVALGQRGACRLASGDADGIAGQAARLSRVLQPFRALPGGLTLIAEGGAGHAARRAAESIPEVGSLVTLGTPFGLAAFSILTAEPAASTLRLLDTLIPPESAAEPFDDDLALGRDLVRGLLALANAPTLADELSAPAEILAVPRAGLAVHAVFGNVTGQGVSRAMTAIVAAGMSTRAVIRAAHPDVGSVTGVGAGLSLPLSFGAGGISVTGRADVEFFGADLSGAPALRQSRPLSIHIEIRRADGWLVGGPGGTSGQDLRWLEFNLTAPLGSGGAAQAEVVLHEARVFTIHRDRWVVRHAGSLSASDGVVTPALPEVGVLLSGVLRELALDADAGIATFLDLLETAGVFSLSSGGQGGFVASALDSILNQPDVHFRQLVADNPTRLALQPIVDAIAAPIPGLAVDLAQKRMAVTLAGVPGTVGLLEWSLSAFATATGDFGGDLRLGSPGACLRVGLNPFIAAVEWPRPGQPAPDIIPVWPQADISRLVAELPSVLIASAIRLGLDYLRELDDGARPVIEAVLDAIGLLAGEAGAEVRQVRVPLAFLSDPVAWFRDRAAFGDASGNFSPARVAGFIDALKPLIGVNGGPGEILLAPGVAIAAVGNGGALRLALALDGSALASPTGNPPRLAFGGTFGLEIAPGGALKPVVDIFAGLPGAASGQQAVHLTASDGVRLFVRPPAGGDISLYPNPPGLGSVGGAALQVLPFVLDKIAALNNPAAAASAALVVRTIGDALDLRSGAQPKFDPAKLAAWAGNPAQRFADRLPQLLQPTLAGLAGAIGPMLPAGLTISAPAGHILVQAGPVEIDLTAAPFNAEIRLNAAGVPFAEQLDAIIAFDSLGLKAFSGAVGPAVIPVNGVALRPLIGFAAGRDPPGGARVEIGGALDAAGTKAVFARWTIPGGSFALVSRDGANETSDAEAVALAMVRVALDLVARFAMQTPALQALLDKTVPHTTVANTKVRALFRGVFLEDTANAASLDPALFDPALLLGRFMQLLKNTAAAGPTVEVGSGLAIGVRLAGPIVKLTLGVAGRVDIVNSDIRVSIEADSRWIRDQPPAGLEIGFLDITGPVFRPSLSVNGIGIRIGRSSGPLLDSVIKLGSVAVHFFGEIASGDLSGGVQLQFSDLAVGAGGAGGDNQVAQGIMGDTGTGSNALAPAFSPALAVQKHSGGPILVSLSAGDGDGPWWLSIQKGFGPLYVEQVGFGVTVRQDQLEKIAVLFDGRVSIAGLVASVDDLQVTFTVTSGASLFDASKWTVDLAGLAVSADIAGVTLAGGQRKFTDPQTQTVEYVGMLMARVATYGLSIYGGYGTGVSDGGRFSAFFAFGAITGPIGGPPAFFVTGIGGGFGINRDLIFPQSLQTFADFVMIKALDPSASASPDPMQELARVRDTFPMRRDRFWFAAGLSFTSFALVDGVAVVAVSFGGGFEMTLLGLARMALPRPQLRLVSIELGLMVRFSTRDGVMWIQAELTENSWLLHESVRLTGGFAYVMWFSGERAGEFVLTLGGYHPNFHRDGYPQVPRLGFRWQAGSSITIKGENYFALTSEALMAGGALEASAKLGPAWANVSFGANAIIYFDPFRYEADAHARISAGVTIDLWLGEITISVSLGAKISVWGPDFHGKATFEVGPIDLTVEFGGSTQSAYEPISWEAFVAKYLEAASPGVARVLTAMPGKGSIPPGIGTNGEEKGTADGSPAKPFEVFSEFELTVTTIAPATSLTAGAGPVNRTPSHALGIAPVGDATMTSSIALHLYPIASVNNPAFDKMGVLRLASTSSGAFPIGAWGPIQPREDKKVPAGEIIEALNGARFVSEAAIQESIPAEIDYNQIEAGPRKPLPFVTEKADRVRMLLEAGRLTDLLPSHVDQDIIYHTVVPWMADAGNSQLSLVSLRGGRAAPPMLGALGGRMAQQTPGVQIRLAKPDPAKTFDRTVHPPRAIAILAPLSRRETTRRRTTVKSDLPRVLPPTLEIADTVAERGFAAKLLRLNPRAAIDRRTVVATRAVPMTQQARMAPAAVDGRGSDKAGRERLGALTNAVSKRRARGTDGEIQPGEVAVMAMPNAHRDSDTGARPALTFTGYARVVMLGAGGAILADITGAGGKAAIPQGAERVAVWAGSPQATGLSGWHDGQSLAYVGWSTCLCGGGSVHAENAMIRRGPESFKAGWIGASEFVEGSRLVTTTFVDAAATIVVLLDELVSGDPAAEFSLSLDGASIAHDAAGGDIAPIVLSSGARRVLVYAVSSHAKGAMAVKILRDGTMHVAGVMASAADAAIVAAKLTEQSPENAVDDALPGPGQAVGVEFVAARKPAGGRRKEG